jgi:predicted membrane protein
MGFLFSGIFWGSILILLGISVIIRIVFNIHVPLVRIVFALILIYFGVRVLIGGSWCRSTCNTNTVLFSEVKTEFTKDSNEYNIIFGKGSVSFTDSALAANNRKIKVNTIFSAGEIKINPALPAIITVNSAFAGAKMPDGTIISFGKYIYKTKGFSENSPALRIDATVVFGGLEITEK